MEFMQWMTFFKRFSLSPTILLFLIHSFPLLSSILQGEDMGRVSGDISWKEGMQEIECGRSTN
jgi:hypothetical protein